MSDPIMDSVFQGMADKQEDMELIRFISESRNKVLVTDLEKQFTSERVQAAHKRRNITLSMDETYFYNDEAGQDDLFISNLAKL